MASARSGEAFELLDPQATICSHLFDFIKSMSLRCAIQLGILDIIFNHGKPMTLSELFYSLPINNAKAPYVHRLMRILVHSGFLVEKMITESGVESKGYMLTSSSMLFLKNEPFSLAPLFLCMIDPVLLKPWYHLSKWFQNDDPTAFKTAHGMMFWDYGEHHSTHNSLFNQAMANDARVISSVLVKDYKQMFEGLNSIVDVGGGTGMLARAIAEAFPHLKCTVLDLPHVVGGLKGTNNLNYVAGDMFEFIPPADAILFKVVLHNWNDEEAIKILKKCREAIPSKEKGGKVIILDMVMDFQKEDKESLETKLSFDLQMMLLLQGKERSEQEWAKLFFDAGFEAYKMSPFLRSRSLIEVYP